MPSKKLPVVEQRILAHIEQQHWGSGNIEVEDAVGPSLSTCIPMSSDTRSVPEGLLVGLEERSTPRGKRFGGTADGQVVVGVSLPKPRFRLFNKPLPRDAAPLTPVADLTRTLLELVYWRVSEKHDEEWVHRRDMQLEKEKVQYWRSIPVEALWKETCCTIRLGFSGNEVAVITRKQLKELRNGRNVYRHVRELLQLAKHMSLVLYFAECRAFKRKWQRHEVRCDDGYMGSYLEGAVLEAVMHP